MISTYFDSKELLVSELLHDPVAITETLFTEKVNNFDTLSFFEDDNFFKVRLYQLPMISYEYLIADDPSLTPEENFNLKKAVGDCFAYCGRKIGKSLFLLIDLLLDTVHNFKDWVTAFSSMDYDHLEHILEPYIKTMKSHPFFKLFRLRVKRNPYKLSVPSGHRVEGINMNLSGRKKGTSWEKVHANKIVMDEHQYEPFEVANKRSQSTSEFGAIYRFFGITSFNKNSPAGNIFFDKTKSKSVINLPEYVSPSWNEKRKQEAIKDYGGEETLGYKVNVDAEVCESAEGLYNIERIRECYKESKFIKRFELKRDDLNFLEDIIIVERPKWAHRCFLCADYGESLEAPSEVVIIFETIEDFYKYTYNISLFGMFSDEQEKVFKYLIDVLYPEVIGLDTTDGGGRALYRSLLKEYGEKYKDNLIAVKFNSKLPVDIKKDDNGKIVYNNKGEMEYIFERVDDWSIKRIKDIFYNKKIEIPMDYKLDKQFSAMKQANLQGRTTYASSEADHLHQAFQVFGISQWLVEFRNLEPIKKTESKSLGIITTL